MSHDNDLLVIVITFFFTGPLAVVNSNIDSLLRFAHLSSIGVAGGSVVSGGVEYAAVVTGADQCGQQPCE